MAWEQQVEYFDDQDDVVFELFEEDITRYSDAEQQVKDEVATNFANERALGKHSQWYMFPGMTIYPNSG